MSDLRSPVSDYLSQLEPHEWRFEATEPGPVLRCYAIGDGRKIPVYIELNMKDDPAIYANVPMSDESRAALGRWWEGEMSKPF